MSARSHHAFQALQRRFRHECKRFSENQKRMEELEGAYFAYRGLLHEQRELAILILKIFAILGAQSPSQTGQFADGVRQVLGLGPQEAIGSSDLLDGLKLWEILELFLSSLDDKATTNDFRDFLFDRDIHRGHERVNVQAVNSAVKTHPEIFEERSEDGQKFILLKSR